MNGSSHASQPIVTSISLTCDKVSVNQSRLSHVSGSGLTGVSSAITDQSTSLESMRYQHRFSKEDRVQIISGKHKGATGTVDANAFQRSFRTPNDHSPYYHVLLNNHLVFTINVNQVEAIHETVPHHHQPQRGINPETRR